MPQKRRKRPTADSVIEGQLDNRIIELGSQIDGDVLTFCGPIRHGVDGLIRESVEAMFGGRQARKPKLAMVLQTTGGYIEAAELNKMVGWFRLLATLKSMNGSSTSRVAAS